MVLRIDTPPLQTFKQCGPLRGRETHAAVHDRRPPEIRSGQRLPDHHQSRLIPGDDLDSVGPARAEDHDHAREGVFLQHFPGERCQALLCTPSLDRPKVEFRASLLCTPSLDRPKVEFRASLLCTPSLDRPKVEFRASLLCTPSLDRPKVEFRASLLCTPSLDRPKVEFRASFHDDGLGAPSGFCSEIGDLWPIAPCGRTSL
jgi:hypothetical protein